jgi:hypothetical protein
MLPKSTGKRQAGQSILGDVRGDVGKVGDKGGEKERGGERQEVKMQETRDRRLTKSRCRK